MDDQDAPQDEQDVVEESQEQSEGESVETQVEEQAVDENQSSEESQDLKGYEKLDRKEQQAVQDLSEEELSRIVSRLQTDENGTVDLKDVVKVLHQENSTRAQDIARKAAEETYLGMRQEERAWEQAYDKYPDLRANRDLFELVRNQQTAAVMDGKYLTPSQAAEKVFKFVGAKQQETAQASQESVRVQQAAHLESAGVQAAGDSTTQALVEGMGSRNNEQARSSREAFIKQMIEKGQISTSA